MNNSNNNSYKYTVVKITKLHGTTLGKLMIKLNVIAVSHDLSILLGPEP